MRFKRKRRQEPESWLIVAGVVVAGAAAAYAISRLLHSGPVTRRRDMRSLEKGVLQSLLDDPVASTQGIDIAAVGSGIIELSGSVDTMGAARHIIALVDRLPGVHAVVNRLDIEEQEDRLRHNRSQTTGGTRWYGGSVGIGKRRQGAQTDPARRDDHAALLTRSLRPNRDDTLSEVEEAEGTGTRIGLTAAGPFTTDVPPRAPNRSADRPGPPPPAET